MMIWRDGVLIEQSDADAADRGAYLGDGLFETILWSRGRAVRLHRHLARLTASAEALGFAHPDLAGIENAFSDLARAHQLEDGVINLRLSAQGPRGLDRQSNSATLSARISPFTPNASPLRLATVTIRRNESAPSSRHKTLSYIDQIAARREARALGADEALQLNTAGNLACAAAGNLIFILDGRALTPKVTDGALPGTVRAELLERALISETTITPKDAKRATTIAITNATFGVRAASAWDGHALDQAHPLLAALRAAIES